MDNVREARQSAGPEGTFGSCVGQVLGNTEVFLNNIDEDCDGHDDECSAGVSKAFYLGPAGTQGSSIHQSSTYKPVTLPAC